MLSRTLFYMFVLYCASSYSNGQRDKKFFREDYTYIESTEAFYKLHTLEKAWIEAKIQCALEGASLFYPEDENEANAVISFWTSSQSSYWIFVGISDSVTQRVFETIDGRPVTNVYNRWERGEPNNSNGEEDCVVLSKYGFYNDDGCLKRFPFICKKSLQSLQENELCNIPNTGQRDKKFFRNDYTYIESTETFYKVHTLGKSWLEAKMQCAFEEASLFYPEDENEANAVISFWTSPQSSYWIFVGISDSVTKGVFETIDGRPVSNVYNRWAFGEPNNYNGEENCVVLSKDGLYNDDGCLKRFPFICKKSLQSLQENELCNIPSTDTTRYEEVEQQSATSEPQSTTPRQSLTTPQLDSTTPHQEPTTPPQYSTIPYQEPTSPQLYSTTRHQESTTPQSITPQELKNTYYHIIRPANLLTKKVIVPPLQAESKNLYIQKENKGKVTTYEKSNDIFGQFVASELNQFGGESRFELLSEIVFLMKNKTFKNSSDLR